MEMSDAASVWSALLIAVVLAGLHLAAPRIRKLPFVPERARPTPPASSPTCKARIGSASDPAAWAGSGPT